MDNIMNVNNTTFIIATYKSQNTIYDCINSIPKEVKKIVVENSNNEDFKIDLENKYENLKCYLMNENLGYGKANNFGINKSDTAYVFILNPDAKLLNNSFEDMCKKLNNKNFSIAGPIVSEELKKYSYDDNGLAEVDFIKGFAMILNKEKFRNNFFDENIFLYLEEIDLCKRVKDEKGRIIKINVLVEHSGGLSHGNKDDIEMEKSRNWHWMWSKFYYNHKHKGYFFAIINTFPNFISSIIKYLIYKLMRKDKKKDIYKMRLLGLFNSYMLKKSFYRPYSNH